MSEKTINLSEKFHNLNPFEILRSNLFEKHHPYGLLLMSAPLISASTSTPHIDSSGLAVSSLSTGLLSGTEPGTSGKLISNVSSAGVAGSLVPGNSPEVAFSSAGFSLSLMNHEKDKYQTSVGALLSSLGASAGSNPDFANILRNSFEFTRPQAEVMILPLLAFLKKREQEPISDQKMEIQNDKIRTGSVEANVFVYSGNNGYTVEGNGLNESYVMKPGDNFLVIHVNQNCAQYAQMGTFERVKQIKRDFQDLCRLLDYPEQFGLNDQQKEQVASLKDAPIIGVSHLVRLITTRGLPTWNIDALPKIVRLFHTIDSNLVSKKFGGERKVKQEDIKVMFITPAMRRLVTS